MLKPRRARSRFKSCEGHYRNGRAARVTEIWGIAAAMPYRPAPPRGADGASAPSLPLHGGEFGFAGEHFLPVHYRAGHAAFQCPTVEGLFFDLLALALTSKTHSGRD